MSEQQDDIGLDGEAERGTERKRSRYEDLPKNDARRLMYEAIRGHVLCLKPVCFIGRADKEMISREAFDGEFNAIVNIVPEVPARYKDHAAKFAIASPGLRKVRRLCYRPGQGEIVDGMFNMWKAPAITPLEGRPEIFFEHMKYLIPNPDELKRLVQWMAWAVQRPNEKLMFALLIVGRGGTGKSWIGKLFEVLFGEENVTLLDEDAPLKSEFQEFKLHKRLLFVHEIAPDEKTDLVRSLKGFITESTVRINRKNIEREKVENFCNLMAVSNYPNALKIVRDDRRWLVVQANDDVFGVDENSDPTDSTMAYYDRLFGCIGTPAAPGDEARRILHYLMNAKLTDFNGKSLAPITVAKDDVAAAGETTIEQNVRQARQDRTGPFGFSLFTVQEVLEACAVVKHGEELTSIRGAVSKAMGDVGCRRVAPAGVKSSQIEFDGQRVRLWAATKAAAERFGKMTPAELVTAYKAERSGKAEPKGKAKPEGVMPAADSVE